MPSSTLLVDQAAATVSPLPSPLIFLDTAAILDILRVPFRQALQVSILESAVAMIDDVVADPRRLWVVTTANVIKEFTDHRESVQKELGASISKLNESITRFWCVAKTVVPERHISYPEWLESTIRHRVSGITDRLVDSALVFSGTDQCATKARHRVWAGLPPASKSKQEYKDCEIFEEFLELVGTLRSRGFDKPAVFVTSNNHDYGDAPGGCEQIASDLAASNAFYAANIAWAYAVAMNAG